MGDSLRAPGQRRVISIMQTFALSEHTIVDRLAFVKGGFCGSLFLRGAAPPAPRLGEPAPVPPAPLRQLMPYPLQALWRMPSNTFEGCVFSRHAWIQPGMRTKYCNRDSIILGSRGEAPAGPCPRGLGGRAGPRLQRMGGAQPTPGHGGGAPDKR